MKLFKAALILSLLIATTAQAQLQAQPGESWLCRAYENGKPQPLLLKIHWGIEMATSAPTSAWSFKKQSALVELLTSQGGQKFHTVFEKNSYATRCGGEANAVTLLPNQFWLKFKWVPASCGAMQPSILHAVLEAKTPPRGPAPLIYQLKCKDITLETPPSPCPRC